MAILCTARFKIQPFYVLSTHCIYVPCTAHFTTQHELIGFYNRYGVYCAVRNGYLNTIQVNFHL